MARSPQTTPLRDRLTRLLPDGRIIERARELGVVIRDRKLQVHTLVWTLVLGFQVGAERTIEGLRVAYNQQVTEGLVRSSFHDHLTAPLARLLRCLAIECIETLSRQAGVPAGYLAGFRELLVMDATIVRLRSLLGPAYPACRTNHTQAAAKFHLVMNVVDSSLKQVRITSERTDDRTPWRRVGAWVRGCLLLFDLGYYSFHLFDRIDRNGGYFLTRLKSNANPLILRANRRWRGASIPVLGAHLQDVLGSLKRQVLDVQVLVRFRRRTYRDRRSVGQQPLRLVALRDPDSPRYHCFLTNVPTRRLRAEDIARTYALRWQVEILFKAMKHHGHLDQLPSEKKCVVDCLIWASLLAVMVSQTLRRLILRMLPKTRFVPLLRWAALFARIANALLRVVLAPDPEADTQLLRLLIQDAPDPNLRRRDRALARVVAAHAT